MARAGVFEQTFVKLVPRGTFWTACFPHGECLSDVDIVLPVQWVDTVLEEVDLELDILHWADRRVYVRDQSV